MRYAAGRLLAAALAVVAMSVVVVVGATPLEASTLVRRTSAPSFFTTSEPLVERSTESREASVARIKRAKLAAAKRALRETALHERGQRLLKRHIDEVNEREGVSKRDLERRAVFARALKRYRCGTDRVCAKAVTSPSDLPTNGRAFCNKITHICAVGCQPGYILASGTCIQSQPTCGPNTCGTTPNGVFLCSGGSVCTLACDTANGYVATNAGTCVNVETSPDNCGAAGTSCPGSYNGVGTAACRNRRCILSCPRGTTLRRTLDGQALYCYGR